MAVLGIDIGTQNSVLATIHRGVVSVVRTELADRLTPSLVLFSQGHRLMGDHAAPLVRSQAKACCRSFKNLLGEVFSESSRVPREQKFQLAEVAEAPGGVAGFKVRTGAGEEVLPASRVCGAFLTKLQQLAEAATGRTAKEVVLSCPCWFRERNRQALLDAARVAGLSCLRVVSDLTATALDYGLYRRQHFTEKPTVVAFVSVGHSAAAASVAAFTAAGGEVLAEVSNPDLGGRDLDLLIAQHFAKIFEKQHGLNPLENLKARLKLEDQAERTKKILSANSETTFAIECLMEDRDLSGLITRELFEELCANTFKPSLLKLLQQALNISGLQAADIAFVEAVGGCTRIPWIQKCISEAFGKEISRTLSGDECVARGCALQAAMASLHFKVKEFDFGEKLWHPVALRWTGEGPVQCSTQQMEGGPPGDPQEGAPPAGCREIELPLGTPTNTLRKITFIRSASFEVHAAYKDLDPNSVSADLGRLTEKEVLEFREMELEMINEDRVHREKQEKLNELETAVYVLRDGLAGPLSNFASPNEKQNLNKVLEEVESWVYEHQQDPQLTKTAIAQQLQQLAALAAPVQHRQQQQQRRQAAAEKLRATIQECRHTATAAAPEYAHIEQQVMQQLLQAAEADEGWLNRVMQEAAAQPPTENPTVLAETIEQRNSDLFAFMKKICSTPKPRPAASPAPPAAASEDEMDVEGAPRQQQEEAAKGENAKCDQEFKEPMVEEPSDP
ncbi:heat shock protein, putative [Eimeria tenella]|uniref:Heat shock protein, putative n=1 Tax=Eimeria tenella TaxID=5802 RepID=U6KU66_EIMTE|nr:heat shock protein, putative [Eimeria tenella]CDJ41702.1 heat shock protein, putative [Eimeria tenella]|eukprot:XP_013232452.1 heat shock protein, putative [Eimeria tenella]